MDLSSYLVAHRGDQDAATENTLLAFQAAVGAGARFIECDIQFCRDLTPVVLHDDSLGRLCGKGDAMVIDLEPDDLRQACTAFKLLTLDTLLAWLERQPDVTLFLEIKPAILSRYPAAMIPELLGRYLRGPRLESIVLISQSAELLEACESAFKLPLGWVVEENRKPGIPFSYVFLEQTQKKLIPFWKEKGVKTVVYTINSANEMIDLRAAGADFVETNLYVRMSRELGHAFL